MFILSILRCVNADFGLGNTRKVICSSINNFCVQRMSTMMYSYEEAVYALNGLQSNSSVLQKARLERDKNAHLHLSDTEKCLRLLGIKTEELDDLNVIHVAGTKGKGSTCALSESILQHHGYKTGFFSSPHLISVNERIRVSGQPIKKELFAAYFWHVYRTIQDNKEYSEEMPSYFKFLTIMAYFVFMKEKVDCAIMEVGIGGLYDCTNIIKTPIVIGIAALGIDHVSLLGDTIAKIAEHKAGIFKPNVPVFTVPQPEGAIAVLHRRAKNVGCDIFLSPPLEAYEKEFFICDPGVPKEVYSVNSSLAVQLCQSWLNHTKMESSTTYKNSNFSPLNVKNDEYPYTPIPMAPTFPLSKSYCKGLSSCRWPGRFYVIRQHNVTYYLDGAHTAESMSYCSRWFKEVSQKGCVSDNCPVCRVLVFNCTGERNAEILLDPLSDLEFDIVLFSPNKKAIAKDSASDLCNLMVDPKKEMEQCEINREIWCHLMRSMHENALNSSSLTGTTPFSISSTLESKYCFPENTLVLPCLNSVVNLVSGIHSDSSFGSISLLKIISNSSHVQVLVTGSLHLVGGMLSIIDPDLQNTTSS